MIRIVDYYKNAYSMLRDLEFYYKDGFKPTSAYNFWSTMVDRLKNNSQLTIDKINSLDLCIMVALLGLNKETIDKSERYEEYGDFQLNGDFRYDVPFLELKSDSGINLDLRSIQRFDSFKTKHTIFDNWLSINKAPEIDDTPVKTFKRVRNGFLHSNFNLEVDSVGRSYTHIKTKSYYESLIINGNFYQFLEAYSSNVGTVGLTETDFFINIKKSKLDNLTDLYLFLRNAKLIFLDSKMDKYDGTKYFGEYFNDVISPYGELDSHFVDRAIFDMEKEGISITGSLPIQLEKYEISAIIKQIKKNYPDFFNYTLSEKNHIVINNIVFFENSKASISNWFLHFSYLLNRMHFNNFNPNDDYIRTDIYAKESCSFALSLLKAYLILYRMEYIKDRMDDAKFDPLDYSKIDFDLEADDYDLEVTNKNDSNFSYETLVQRQLQRDPNQDRHEIDMRIITSIIRDALAHGKVYPYFLPEETCEVIELVDINPNNSDEEKIITMPLDKFNKFLNSEAFLPKHCYKNRLNRKL